MLISIILPVYNGENTISYAIESVLSQSYKKFELIVVNDGSKDHTEELIRNYQEADDRIRVINQKNKGVSAARNVGIDHAKGRYIGFLDADDLISRDALKYVHQIAVTHDPDMIAGRYERMDGISIYQSTRINRMTSSIWVDKNDLNLVFCMSVYIKWFRKDILDSFHIRFENYRYLEDAVFTYHYLNHINKIYTCPYIIYRNIRPLVFLGTSVTRNVNRELFDQAWPAYQRILALTKDYGQEFLSTLQFRILQSIYGNVFYRKIWAVDKKSEQQLYSYMESLYAQLNQKWKDFFLTENADYVRNGRIMRKEEHVKNPMICVTVLDMNPENIRPFLLCLYDQTEPSFIICFERSMKRYIPFEFKRKKNLFFRKKDELAQLLFETKARYITFINRDICYEIRSVKDAVFYLEKQEVDSVFLPLVEIPAYLKEDQVEKSQEFLELSAVFFRTERLRNQPEALEYLEDGDYDSLLSLVIPDRYNRTCILDNSNHIGQEFLMSISCQDRGYKKEKNSDDPKKMTKQFYLDQYLDLDINKKLFVFVANHPSRDFVVLLKRFAALKKQFHELVLAVPKESLPLSESIFNDVQNSSGLKILPLKGKSCAKKMFSAAFIITEEALPYWWIKKPGQRLIYLNWITDSDRDTAIRPDPGLQYLLMNMDASLFSSCSYRKTFLKEQYMERLCKAVELSDYLADSGMDVKAAFLDYILNGDWEKPTQGIVGPTLYFSENLTNKETLSLIDHAFQSGTFSKDEYLCLFNSELVKTVDGDRELKGHRYILLKTIGFSARTARRAYFGEMEPKVLVLMDCTNPYYLRCFFYFGEKVYWIIGKEIVDMIRSGDEQIERLIKLYEKSKHVLVARDRDTSDYIKLHFTFDLPVIRQLSDFKCNLDNRS